MADDIAKLGIEIKSGDIVKARRELDRLEKQSKENVSANKKLRSSFTGLGTAIGALGLAAGIMKVVRATAEQERVVAQLDAAIRSTGAGAGFTSRELQDMAGSLQDVTTFGDEAIIGMQSILLTFTSLKGDILPKTTQAVLDLSARMGQDLTSSALMLGKALNDPVANLGALSRSGIQFSVDQKAMIKSLAESGRLADAQTIILKELETQFGGSAKAARDTFGGAIKGLSNAMGDLLEGKGGSLTDAKESIEELTAVMKDPGTVKAFSTITSGIVSMTSALAKGVTALAEFGDKFGVNLSNTITPSIDALQLLDQRMAETTRLIEEQNAVIEDKGFFGLGGSTPEEISEAKARIDALNGTLERQAEIRTRLLAPGEEGATPESGATALGAPALGLEEKSVVELDQEEKDKLTQQENEHWARINEERIKGLSALEQFTSMSYKKQSKTVIGELANMTAGVANSNKTMFKLNQAAGIANAIVNTYTGVTQALAAYPPPLSFAMAAAQLGAGLAQVSAIKSTTFGGGGGTAPSLVGLGGGSDTVNTVGVNGQTAEQSTPTQDFTFNVSGLTTPETMRDLLDGLFEQLGDGYTAEVNLV